MAVKFGFYIKRMLTIRNNINEISEITFRTDKVMPSKKYDNLEKLKV